MDDACSRASHEFRPENAWLAAARAAMEIEAESIRRAAARLDGELIRAVELILAHPGKVIVTGIGKSGHIARKIVATLCSTGTAAVFLHPAEAVHGDLGIYTPGDPTVLLSNHGSSAELQALVPLLRQFRSPLIGILGNRASPLAAQMDVLLDASVEREADPHNLAPTASAVTALAHRTRARHRADVRPQFHPGGVRPISPRRPAGPEPAPECRGGHAYRRRGGLGGARDRRSKTSSSP